MWLITATKIHIISWAQWHAELKHFPLFTINRFQTNSWKDCSSTTQTWSKMRGRKHKDAKTPHACVWAAQTVVDTCWAEPCVSLCVRLWPGSCCLCRSAAVLELQMYTVKLNSPSVPHLFISLCPIRIKSLIYYYKSDEEYCHVKSAADFQPNSSLLSTWKLGLIKTLTLKHKGSSGCQCVCSAVCAAPTVWLTDWSCWTI